MSCVRGPLRACPFNGVAGGVTTEAGIRAHSKSNGFRRRVRQERRRLVRRQWLLAGNMDSYQVLEQVGEGAYGRVFKGRRKHVGQVRERGEES